MNPFLYTEIMQYCCNVAGFPRRRSLFMPQVATVSHRSIVLFTTIKRGKRGNTKELWDILHMRLAKRWKTATVLELQHVLGTMNNLL